MKNYRKELILDLHDCNSRKFTRKDIRIYLEELCDSIDMERCKLVWCDDLHTPQEETKTYVKGTIVVQFSKTSNITIHTLDILKRVYLNIFSSKNYDVKLAVNYSKNYFEGYIKNKKIIERF